jgi:hypothetical protein
MKDHFNLSSNHLPLRILIQLIKLIWKLIVFFRHWF